MNNTIDIILIIYDIPIWIADILNCSIKLRFEAHRYLFKLCITLFSSSD